jgi:hypothetical protein
MIPLLIGPVVEAIVIAAASAVVKQLLDNDPSRK